jgi:Na+-transporting methylmalonyl-CoA/oxaloacetate decarboxylase gamma subunit
MWDILEYVVIGLAAVFLVLWLGVTVVSILDARKGKSAGQSFNSDEAASVVASSSSAASASSCNSSSCT